jgi:hypothetical protein
MVSFSYGQDIGVGGQLSFDRNFDIDIYRNSPENFEGTPYYNEDWVQGYVTLNSQLKSNNTDLRFSSYSNELFFKQNGQLLAVKPNSFKGFVLKMEDGPVTFKNGFESSEHDISNNIALEVIYDGTVKLLSHHEKKIFERQSDPLTGEFTKSFNSISNHYLVDRNGTWHEVDLNNDAILEALGDNQDAMEKFADSQDIDFEEKKRSQYTVKAL